MPTIKEITHIHLKKVEDEIQVFIVDNNVKTEERVSLGRAEMKLPLQLSRAILFVKKEHVELLVKAGIIEQAISSELNGITSTLLNKEIHQYFNESDEELFFELNGKAVEAGVIQ